MRVRTARTDYRLSTLADSAATSDPLVLFGRWFRGVLAKGGVDPHAMILATADKRGRPSARAMLLKAWGREGFVFATNQDSRKGHELATNPHGALLFYWPERQRQVRIEGRLALVSDRESRAIWAERPRGAQVGAWASRQSRPIADRAVLERARERAEERFEGVDVPRPPHWGGYRLVPERIEFWQGRADRLHDRLLYVRRNGRWARTRLSP